MAFHDWSAAHSSTNGRNCLRKGCHLSSWAWMVVERTLWSGHCLISVSFIKEVENSYSSRVRDREKVTSVGDDDQEAEDVSFGASESVQPVWKSSKLHGWLNIVLSYSWGYQLLYIEVQYMFTLICIRYLCFHNPPNHDMDYRIFNVPILSFNACVRLNGCLFMGERGKRGLGTPFFSSGGGPLGPLSWNPRSNTGYIHV